MINRDEWLAALEEARTAPLPQSDALTILEFAEVIGRERNMAARVMAKLVAAGKATRTTKQIRRMDGGVISVPAYHLEVPRGGPRREHTGRVRRGRSRS